MKKENICLITGGRWHYGAYKFLLKNNFNITILDDNKNCYLKKKIKQLKIDKLKNIAKYKNNFFWSPCNDLGSHLADKFNYGKYHVRTKNFIFSNNKKKIFKKLKVPKLFVKNIKKNKNYIKKPIFGSGSKNISLYNGKNLIDRNKYFLQELIFGTEISVEIYSFKGNHSIISISLRILKNYKSALCILNLNDNLKLKKQLIKHINQYYNKLQILNGISHLEMIIDKDNKIYPIDINLRMGGAGVSEFLIKKSMINDPFEIDFFTLKNCFEVKKLNISKYGIIIYEYLKNNHLKYSLAKLKNKGYFEKLNSKNKISKSELDKNRLSLLFIKPKNKMQLTKLVKKIFTSKKSKEIIEKIKYLSSDKIVTT